MVLWRARRGSTCSGSAAATTTTTAVARTAASTVQSRELIGELGGDDLCRCSVLVADIAIFGEGGAASLQMKLELGGVTTEMARRARGAVRADLGDDLPGNSFGGRVR